MRIIICGAFDIGIHLAKMLSTNHEDIILIDDNEERLALIGSSFDLLTINASPTSVKALRNAGADLADLFVAVTPDECLNITACVLAKAIGAKKTVAKINNNEYIEQDLKGLLNKLGIDSVIYPEQLAAKDISNSLEMSWVRQRLDIHDGALVMLTIKLRETCEILNNPLKNLCGPDDPYHVVAIKRQNETIIPGGNDELKLYDLVFFMTTPEYIPYIRKIVGKEYYVDVQNVFVMGGGNTAVCAVNSLPSYLNVKLFEINEKRCEELNDLLDSDRTLIINGDGRDIQLLTEEGIKQAQAFVSLTDNAETNILACLTAKRLGVRKTIAMVEHVDYVNIAESLDIGTIINKKSIAASHIYQMMLDDNVNNMRFINSVNADVAELIPKENSKVTKRPMKDLGLPKGITFGGLVRNNKGLLISGDTQIQSGDIVMVFCQDHKMKLVEKYFL
ncbi:MAG: Trk system potassium transporter TrkA [Prevotella sp.]